MAKRKQKSRPTWTDVKAKLADFDRAALLGLIQSLYAAHEENQTFLHARFGLAEDVLEPYKKTIDRWVWPDVFRRQDTSVSHAKRAISDYKKAVGDPEGLAASVPLGFPAILRVTMRDTSMRWCACSSRRSRRRTDPRSAATSL
jgi:hypothetical protein